MSLAVCEKRAPSTAYSLDGMGGARWGGMALAKAAAAADVFSQDKWLGQQEEVIQKVAANNKDGQFDIWASIQSSKKRADDADLSAPYVHPLVRRSRSSLSQKSLEMCTESLGSETGSDGTLSSDDLEDYFSKCKAAVVAEFVEKPEVKDEMEPQDDEEEEEEHLETPPPPPPPNGRKQLESVNYHCSIGWRSPPRSFPPPLPSICRRDGPCLGMRRYRRDGRLVVEAVPVPSQSYLHAQRQDGRLLLTFIETTFQDIYPESEEPLMEQLQELQRQAKEQGAQADAEEAEAEDRVSVKAVSEDSADNDVVVDGDEMGEEEGEEEVLEVVDKGILVEVKVSRPPLPQSGGLRVQRSSVVINKFVGMPLSNKSPWTEKNGEAAGEGENPSAGASSVTPAPRGSANSATTTATAVLAAAAAAALSLSTDERYWRNSKGPLSSTQRHASPEKLFFTSKGLMNRQDLLHQVRRCSEHHRPLFIWEPCCIATS